METRKHINLDEGWTEVTTKIRTRLERGGTENPLIPFPTFDMDVYYIVYAMCTQRPSYVQQLSVKYRELCEEYFTTLVLPAINEGEGEIMLREVVRCLKFYKMTISFMSKCFRYLERCLHGIPLKEVGFRFVSSHNMIRFHVINAMISLIDQEREGELIDNALLKDGLAIYAKIDMHFYRNYFEPAVVESTGAYYARKAASWILQDSCMEYMLKAEECLRREKERVAHYLCSDSEQKLLQRVQDELLLHYKIQLVENEHSGYRVMLREDNRDGLSKMFSLFCRIPEGLTSIVNGFRDHVISKETNPEIVALIDTSHGSQQDAGFVFTVSNMLEKFKKSVKEIFGDNHFHFDKALQEAFEIFCNKRFAGRKSAEFLAMLCRNLLQKGARENLSNDHIEDVLDRVFKFVVCVTDEYQVFAEIYRYKLADRLLFNQGTNENHERSILSKLTQKIGVTFTYKMKGMIADLTQSREWQSSFEAHLIENPNIHPGIDFNVKVLCKGLWPSPRLDAFSKLNLPSEMVKCVEVFTDFYSTKTERRRLTWIYSLGSCNIIGTFDAGQIEMIATTYQAVLLLLFNASEKLSYSYIKSQLNLTDEDLVSVLYSLALTKYKLLLKEPNTPTITPRDNFQVNLAVTDKRKKIRLPKPGVEEFKRVAKDRSSAIDALLVRIMKNAKVFPYKQLLSECIQKLESMFKTDEQVIAKRIRDLIRREFFEFDKQDSKILRYLP